jgi:hypothetical protein
MRKLPKEIFIKIERDGDTEYPIADTDIANLVPMGEKVLIGTYKLIETFSYEGEAVKKPLR